MRLGLDKMKEVVLTVKLLSLKCLPVSIFEKKVKKVMNLFSEHKLLVLVGDPFPLGAS